MNSISPNLNIMIKACEKASKILIRDFGEIEKLQVSKKGPKDFVTSADRKVEKVLINELSKKKFSIISEEAGKLVNTDNKNFWIIDPIDGTMNFLHGIPHFCISIAFLNNQEIGSLDWIEYRQLKEGSSAFKEIHDGSCIAPKIILLVNN